MRLAIAPCAFAFHHWRFCLNHTALANIFMALTVIVALCAGGNVHAQSAPADKMILALARSTITPAEETFTIAVPEQMGFFKQEGIAVSIIPANGSTAALQAVASGHADIAFASSVNIAAAIEKGMPLKAFAGLTVRWPYYIGVPNGSPIKTVADLKGRRIGVISMSSASYADLKANLRLAGVSESEVTIIPVGAGATAIMALHKGEVDAIDSYSDSFTVFRQNGIALTLLPRPAAMEKLFSVTMVTSEKTLRERPQALIGFARAAYKGIIYTYLYPQNALELSFTQYPQLPGSDEPAGLKARNTLEAMHTALADSLPSDPQNAANWKQWLNIGPERWQALLDFAFETGQISKRLTPSQVWDGSLMPQIYNFDTANIPMRIPSAPR